MTSSNLQLPPFCVFKNAKFDVHGQNLSLTLFLSPMKRSKIPAQLSTGPPGHCKPNTSSPTRQLHESNVVLHTYTAHCAQALQVMCHVQCTYVQIALPVIQ